MGGEMWAVVRGPTDVDREGQAGTKPARQQAPITRGPRRAAGGPRRLLLMALLTVMLIALVYAGLSVYMAATLTRVGRQAPGTDPRALGLQVEDVAFRSREDGLTLRGWLLPATDRAGGTPSDRLIMIVHGRNGVRDDAGIGLLPIARALIGAGYNVLLFDLRGHGESEGERFSLGWYERRDLKGALDWAEGRGFSRIGIYGFSMGGATALLTAAEDPRIAAVAVDSAYTDLGELLAVQIPKQSGLPPVFTPGVIVAVRLLYGADAGAVRPDRAITQLGVRPLLILHGEMDGLVPVDNARRLFAAAACPTGGPCGATVHLFPHADHVKSYRSDPDRYLAIVVRFWQTALP